MQLSDNDNERGRLEVEVVESRDCSGVWIAEAIDHRSEGEIYRAVIDGPNAKLHALNYARYLTTMLEN